MRKFVVLIVVALVFCVVGCNKSTVKDSSSMCRKISEGILIENNEQESIDKSASDTESSEETDNTSSVVAENNDSPKEKTKTGNNSSTTSTTTQPSSSEITSQNNNSSYNYQPSMTIIQNIVEPSQSDLEYMATQVFNKVNEVRVQNGKSVLERSSVLDSATKIRAVELHQLFSHTRPNGESCFTAISGEENRACGENIAKYSISVFDGSKEEIDRVVQVMHDALTNSPGHFQNMIGDYTCAGMGCSYTVLNPDSQGYILIEFTLTEMFMK